MSMYDCMTSGSWLVWDADIAETLWYVDYFLAKSKGRYCCYLGVSITLLSIMTEIFYVMGKGLSGKLSSMWKSLFFNENFTQFYVYCIFIYSWLMGCEKSALLCMQSNQSLCF